MKIKSITDVITNSSSEVYIIHPMGDQTPESIYEDLLRINKEFLESGEDQYSGDVQDIELLDEKEKIHKKVYWPKYLLDRGFCGTKKYIEDNYCIHKIEYWG